MQPRYWCWLCKLASSAAICTYKVTSEWCSSYLAGKGRIPFSCLQIQRMITHCVISHWHSEVNWNFFKGASLLIIGHLSLKRVFPGGIVLYLPMLILKPLFVAIAVAFPKKNQLFPCILHHFSLPSKPLTAVKPNRIRTRPPLKPTTTSSSGQSSLQVFRSRSEMQQHSQTPDSSIMIHQSEMQDHRLITWDEPKSTFFVRI